MKILAIDSSGLVATAAVWEGDPDKKTGRILSQRSTDFKKTHSQTLLPMIDGICADTECKAEDFDAVVISAGPGSFTGLRIGSATAKAIALAADIPVVEVPTLHGLAFNLSGNEKLICPMMDARRDQVYTALFTFEDGKLVVIKDQMAVSLDEILSLAKQEQAVSGKGIIFLGDGADAYRDRIESGMEGKYEFAPAHLNRQSAASFAVLGAQLYADGKIISSDDHKPVYLRTSQAEREGAKNFDLRQSVNG